MTDGRRDARQRLLVPGTGKEQYLSGVRARVK
jgi:hypothetical protein